MGAPEGPQVVTPFAFFDWLRLFRNRVGMPDNFACRGIERNNRAPEFTAFVVRINGATLFARRRRNIQAILSEHRRARDPGQRTWVGLLSI